MSAAKPATKSRAVAASVMKLPDWLSKTNFYILEYAVGLLAMLITVFLLDHALYALLQYLNDRSLTENLGESAVKTVGLAVVWMPLAMALYLRTRSQEQAQKSLESDRLRKFFSFVFMAIIVISTAIFAYFAVRGLLDWIFQAQLPKEALVGVFLPALLSAIVGKYVIWQSMQENTLQTTQRFVRYLGGAVIVVMVVLFIVGFVKARDAVIDSQTSADLSLISNDVNNYANAEGAMPSSLADLNLPNSVLARGSKYGYSYTSASNGEFKVCADFKGASGGTGKADEGPDFLVHGAGFQCFTLAVGESNTSSSQENLQSELEALESQEGSGSATTNGLY